MDLDRTALQRVVAVINGKGGVLKTSLTTNVAGYLATTGMRVLVVDLDVSGNTKLDLGLIEHPQEDGGRGLVDSVYRGDPLPVARDVRPGLDLVFGGSHLELLTALAKLPTAADLPGGSVPDAFAHKLAEVAGDYDLVLLDCPPGTGDLQDMALAAARWVLIPTRTDQGSLDGLLAVGPRVRRARQTNPDLAYLGVALTAHSQGASRIRRATREMLEEVGDTIPLLDTFIRYSEAAAHDCRARGQLAHELARDVDTSRASRLAALRRRTKDGGLPAALADTAGGLAGDYQRLAHEICDRITAAETGQPASAGSVAR